MHTTAYTLMDGVHLEGSTIIRSNGINIALGALGALVLSGTCRPLRPVLLPTKCGRRPPLRGGGGAGTHWSGGGGWGSEGVG